MVKSAVAVQKQPEAICKEWPSCVPNKTLFLKAFEEQNLPVGVFLPPPAVECKISCGKSKLLCNSEPLWIND